MRTTTQLAPALLWLLVWAALVVPGRSSQALPSVRLRTRTLHLDADRYTAAASTPAGTGCRCRTACALSTCSRRRRRRLHIMPLLLEATLIMSLLPTGQTSGGCWRRRLPRRLAITPPASGGARYAACSNSCSPTAPTWRRSNGQS